jgi:hypothetical protein
MLWIIFDIAPGSPSAVSVNQSGIHSMLTSGVPGNKRLNQLPQFEKF